jgi:hypothetical protein
MSIGEDDGAELSLERSREIARKTAPGKNNDEILRTLDDCGQVVKRFNDMTNGWFEIIDVRSYRNDRIGIPCRYRWTIKRWAATDMDQWLKDNGWELIAHLKADSREHEDDEMEARYRTEINGYKVYANFYVKFPDDVFKALEEGRETIPFSRGQQYSQAVEELRKIKRGNGEA